MDEVIDQCASVNLLVFTYCTIQLEFHGSQLWISFSVPCPLHIPTLETWSYSPGPMATIQPHCCQRQQQDGQISSVQSPSPNPAQHSAITLVLSLFSIWTRTPVISALWLLCPVLFFSNWPYLFLYRERRKSPDKSFSHVTSNPASSMSPSPSSRITCSPHFTE